MVRILVIDDDRVILGVITKILKTSSFEVISAPNGKSGIKRLESNCFDLVLTDLMMTDVDGLEVLDYVLTKSPKTKCIILTGYGTIKSSVDAIKRGAFDYIAKPITSDELLVVIEKALKFRNLEDENIRLKRELKKKYRHDNIIGTSNAIEKIYELIEKVADTDSTVLTTTAPGMINHWLLSTVELSQRNCLRANSLATKKGHLQAPIRQGLAGLRWQMGEQFF